VNPQSVTVPLAALAGLASFLSPCVLALVPAYIGYLSGRSVTSAGVVVENRWATFGHGLAFVLGFSFVFVGLGAAASLVGAVLFDLRTWMARIGGAVVVVFGLHTMGILHIPFLDYDVRRRMRPGAGLNFPSSFVMGIFFSAGWAPCVGPVLGAILTLALNTGSLRQGIYLLIAYSAGLAVPFLLAALGIGRVAEWMRTHGQAVLLVSRATGVVLVVVGVLLMTGALERLARFGFFVDFGI
jgi:cytochrome c-type biogenesis protein